MAKPSGVSRPRPRDAKRRFSERERTARERTEAVTLVEQPRLPDSVWDVVNPGFREQGISDLTPLIIATNG